MLERYQRSEKALLLALAEANLQGVRFTEESLELKYPNPNPFRLILLHERNIMLFN